MTRRGIKLGMMGITNNPMAKFTRSIPNTPQVLTKAKDGASIQKQMAIAEAQRRFPALQKKKFTK
jgi:hypothetical protein